MVKKILKWTGITLLVLLIVLFAAPFLFKDKIKEMLVETINKNVDATVAFEDVDLSLFKSFPRANVTVDKLSIINKAPFAGDTLVYLGELNLKMSVKELFKDAKEGMNIESISTKNGVVNILFNKDGLGNFDIAIKNAEEKNKGDKSDPLSLKVQEYKIENYRFQYFDERSKVRLVLDSLNHTGTGDFTAKKLDLDTKSSTVVSLDMDKVNYLNKVNLNLDAVLGIDLENSKYSFKQNKALINKLPLEFDGFIQLLENGQQYDLTFKTPVSGFQNFLGLIPSAYSGSLANVQTTGDFKVEGFAKGVLSDTTVPKFNIAIASNNASFKYPDLPKSVQNIVIDTKIINETGLMNDTYVNLDKLSFRIDQDVFNAKANIKNLSENPLVDAKLDGRINLGNLTKAYPVKLDKPLSGILDANVETKFDMKSVETSQYQNMQNSGNLALTGFKYTDENNKAINVNKAVVQFNPSRINLQELDATTGKTDMKLSGTLDNFYGFLLKNQTLKGNFNLSSNQFAVADFMTETDPKKDAKTPQPKEAVKIPAFLDCTLTAKANTVLYDNLTLKNVSGKIIIKDQTAKLQDLKTNIFGGLIAVTGDVSTKEATPTFNVDLGLNSVDIQQTFTQLEMMKSIAPIAGVINGKLNSKINVSGKLDPKEMSPILNTINGDLNGQLLSTTINEKTSPLLNKLDESVSFIDLQKLNLNDLKAALTFTNGRVNLKPFTLKYQDIKVDIVGSHGFDQTMGYNLKFDVPAKYFGTEVNKLLAKLSPGEQNKIENIPVTANLTGNFKNPKVSTDMKQAASNLTAQIVKAQKEQLVNQGASTVTNWLNKDKDKPKTGSDTTKTKTNTKNDDIKNAAQGVLDLFGKKKKKEEPKKTN
ncbi:AsmA-like C-terminal region-containing protein [Flavobacterium sp. MAH-1]|uniref:AsmA-like C-terminal region-containing protein n=1 Tax=Flavobacterium agri TaxID=2743471 RepID=A0A7Y8Y5J6_9FLAO|nr:AsmA-like C-terminal region-containing protein [Flavobacterium agri]NUY81651.1 AsmA-like C-terminal region-containing protein [Flavobacterium agri]NYA71675.1 AsmA-like C-terminal region-containing protein [Flavobacterium agri]